ncbi:hypothetical protein C8A03DRAFT_13454 [Achaetomium macrosporum]|uniref:BZIP domain-containing protein n=1 Tax=Achaetomium macrosporum TaxID=79813 RepID=A0AAN7HH43_9PEZI|nr:hypothetical protein C8A03DRAFT_13454 [Achaetomium macrosporum]
MSFQPPPREPPKPSKGKPKAGARRVVNLSEEQRRKKRENDRLAQQNIRRRNKALIDNLQREVEMLRSMRSVQTALSLLEEKRSLEAQLLELSRHTALMLNERHCHPPGIGLSGVDGPSPAAGHGGEYGNVPHNFASPSLSSAHRYDQWPSNAVPVPSPAAIHSVESSPGASGPGEDFGYVHTSVPVVEPAIMASNTSAPALDSIKLEAREVDTGMSAAPSANRYSSPKVAHSSPAYLQAAPWPVYSTSSYYVRAPHRHPVQPHSSHVYPTVSSREGRRGEGEESDGVGR